MENGGETTSGGPSAGAPHRVYSAICGTAVMSPAMIGRLSRFARLGRLVYNAAVDPRVPFQDGLAYRLALDEARRAGQPEPDPPAPSGTFLPVRSAFALGPELTELRSSWPVLRTVPRSVLDNALAEGCRARARHVGDRVRAKAEGRKPPGLRFRSARDDWSVSTDSFWLLRIGTDHAQMPPKKRPAKTSGRNRLRRERGRLLREEAWAAEKRRCGWTDGKVAAGLARRRDRQDRDRQRQQDLQTARSTQDKVRLVRRDSPDATVGARRMKADVAGLGRFRIDLGRAIPEGAEKIRLTLVKPAWREAKVEVRLVVTVPEAKPERCPLQAGEAIHRALRHMPPDAPSLALVEAARAGGIVARGVDLGSAAPFCDDAGAATKPVRTPRMDLRRMKAAQERLSHKDRYAETTAQSTGGESKRRRRRRSKRAQREVDAIRRIARKAANRAETRARQDAASAMRDAPLLVATDPLRMVGPLLAKDGPAARRARREAGLPPSPRRTGSLPRDRERRMRANLLATRLADRIRRLELLCDRAGSIFVTPGHEGTTATCPGCGRHAKKELGERRHVCEPCGLETGRDHASALETLGRALRPFVVSSDPGGAIAAGLAARAAAREEGAARRRRLSERAKTSAARRRAERGIAGASPGHRAVVSSGPSGAGPKRVRGQGRNVRRELGRTTGFPN